MSKEEKIIEWRYVIHIGGKILKSGIMKHEEAWMEANKFSLVFGTVNVNLFWDSETFNTFIGEFNCESNNCR